MNNYQSKGNYARQLFESGYNCSQAVFCAFAEDMGLDAETARRISSSFGGGMGRMREVCGACSGMFMAAGLKYGGYDPLDNRAKAEHYKRIQELAEAFRRENGSIICRELLGLGANSQETHVPEQRTAEYYKKRPCGEIVEIAADILERYISENE